MKTLNIQLTPKLDHDLSFCEQVEGKSKTDLIYNAIQNYINELHEDYEDAEIALARLNDPDSKTYTSEEFEKLLKADFGISGNDNV